MVKVKKDLTGMKFGRWTVLCQAEDHIKANGEHEAMWACQCDCGTIKNVLGKSLKNGSSKSCGCLKTEITTQRWTKHGLRRTRIYNIYAAMIDRCTNARHRNYYDYGGRGIKICDEWLGENGFINFYNWTMNNGYTDELTIDRIDVDGNYEPDNCRWITIKEQQLNKRNNHLVTINGVTKFAREWCEEYNVKIDTFWGRLYKGIEGEDLLAAPQHKQTRNTSGFAGVFYDKRRDYWYAEIRKDKVRYYLGSYKNMKDAVQARLDGEIKYYGKYISNKEDIAKFLPELIDDMSDKD